MKESKILYPLDQEWFKAIVVFRCNYFNITEITEYCISTILPLSKRRKNASIFRRLMTFYALCGGLFI